MNVAPYVALIGGSGAVDTSRLSGVTERLRAMGFALLLDTPGVRFLGRASAPHFLPQPPGRIFWGSVFDRRSAGFALRAGDAELLAPLSRFVTQFWGGYLALREIEGRVELFRDPSGMIPVYLASLGTMHV